MSTYPAERYLPGVTPEQLLDAARRGKGRRGHPVSHLRSTFLPGDQACCCLFEGPAARAVAQANDQAGAPYERIIAAVHVASDDLA